MQFHYQSSARLPRKLRKFDIFGFPSPDKKQKSTHLGQIIKHNRLPVQFTMSLTIELQFLFFSFPVCPQDLRLDSNKTQKKQRKPIS